MDAPQSQLQPIPPSVLTALRAGFDAITNHIGLLLLPIGIDLWIWLGPHLSVQGLMQKLIAWMADSAGMNPQDVLGLQAGGSLTLDAALERLNLMAALRAYPVGIPSMMARRLPLQSPFGQPPAWEVSSWWLVLAFWGLLSLIGLAIGTFYFLGVSQAALAGKVEWKQVFVQWPLASLRILFLALILGVFLLALSIPFSCAFSLLPLGGLQFGWVLYVGLVGWLLFPLLFTPHGLLTMRQNLFVALRKSERLTRLTFPTTILLFAIILVVSEVLDLLWRVPAEDSWFTLLGVAGHAFVATGLLAATFVYYRDADRWVEDVVRKMRLASLR